MSRPKEHWWNQEGADWLCVLCCVFPPVLPALAIAGLFDRRKQNKWLCETFDISQKEAKRIIKTKRQFFNVENAYNYIQKKDAYEAENLIQAIKAYNTFLNLQGEPIAVSQKVIDYLLSGVNQIYQTHTEKKENTARQISHLRGMKEWFATQSVDVISKKDADAIEDLFDATIVVLQGENDPYYKDKITASKRRAKHAFPIAEKHISALLADEIKDVWKGIHVHLQPPSKSLVAT